MVMRWRSIMIGLIMALPIWLAIIYAARAQEEPPPPDEFRDTLCRMAVGNLTGAVQDHFGLYIELYAQPDGTQKTASSYGLLTGTYYGPRGISHHGPTLDAPGSSRYLKGGEPFTNGDSAHLRAITAEFRQGACAHPEPQS